MRETKVSTDTSSDSSIHHLPVGKTHTKLGVEEEETGPSLTAYTLPSIEPTMMSERRVELVCTGDDTIQPLVLNFHTGLTLPLLHGVILNLYRYPSVLPTYSIPC